jgi:hypothetical protein
VSVAGVGGDVADSDGDGADEVPAIGDRPSPVGGAEQEASIVPAVTITKTKALPCNRRRSLTSSAACAHRGPTVRGVNVSHGLHR